MPTLSAIVSELLARRKEMQQELGRLDRAIAALRGLELVEVPRIIVSHGCREGKPAARSPLRSADREIMRWFSCAFHGNTDGEPKIVSLFLKKVPASNPASTGERHHPAGKLLAARNHGHSIGYSAVSSRITRAGNGR